jgi:putative nucleotidyltransferase with HDIG domain
MRANGAAASLGIAVAFAVVATIIMLLRENVVRYRPGQFVPHDIVSRVDFTFNDFSKLQEARKQAGEAQPRYYRENDDTWAWVEEQLAMLPSRAAVAAEMSELPPDLQEILDSGELTVFKDIAQENNYQAYRDSVHAMILAVRSKNIAVLPADQREKDLGRAIVLQPAVDRIPAIDTYTADSEALRNQLQIIVSANFRSTLQSKILNYTLRLLSNPPRPTHVLDERATAEAQNRAKAAVASTEGDVPYAANQPIVTRGKLTDQEWDLLKVENEAFVASLAGSAWSSRLGTAGIVFLITLALAAYVAKFQPRVVRNHARAIAIAALLLSMLLVVQLAGIGNSSLYLFGVAPTILVAMIVTIAYDQRFAVGVATVHAMLVTLALHQGMEFFVVIWVGLLTACFLLEDIRSRSKLIEVSGATAVAMMLVAAAAGAIELSPFEFIAKNCLYAGAAGLGVGFIVLGILPFIEKAFRITTSMTLLELADASHPLLRRLAMEAPGTYNHSLQVATLAENAAEAINANSLLCRVASYYHDVGKIKKADYFVENQVNGHNRHINLSPSVSLLIIIGHVKDGIEMAREYNLPTSIFPFIQQHHGTTLVEYFYAQACNQKDLKQPDHPAISEMQYRYPGPKPKSREVAIVMLADAVEGATRTMSEPTASRIETLVHELAMRRLLDGQFDECDLTMRELELIERSLAKTLLGIYHGRITYPSTSNLTASPTPTIARTA